MFRTLQSELPRDRDLPERAWRLALLQRVLDGTLYDVLPYEFHQERNGAGEYVPLNLRAPSVRYGLCASVVDDTVSLLFGEGHFPQIQAGQDKALRSRLRDLVRATRLDRVMVEAARRGSVGSVCLRLRVLAERPFVDALDTMYLTPSWQPDAPDELLRVVELRKVSGRALVDAGYEIDAASLDVPFWFRRIWDDASETWFLPMPVGGVAPADLPIDAARSARHGLGFVPLVWIRNLPGGDDIDGACTFRAAIETGIEIDYQLSQAGRGLKYSSDPTLLIKEPAGLSGELIRGGANALVLSERGDAKLLEIGGTASQAVIDYVRVLREFALESVHGNRASADRVTAPQSGRAMQMLNQGLVWVTDHLRGSYGDDGLLRLVRLMLRASQRVPIRVAGELFRGDADARLSLRWPPWYPLDAAERQAEATALATLRASGHISRDTAVATVAASYDIDDVGHELAAILQDQAALDRRAGAESASVQIRQPGEG